MTANPDKAMHLLKVLSEDYEKTKNPDTAEKIISLVEKELEDRSFSMAENYRQRMYRQYGLLLYIPFVKKKALAENPFKVYWEISEEREKEHKEKEAERLCILYSTDAKSPSQIKADKDMIEKRVYEAVKMEIGYLARSLAIADEMLGRVMLSRPIMDKFAQEELLSVANFFESAARKVLWIAQCDENGRLTESTIEPFDGYVSYLSNQFVSKKLTNQLCSLSEQPISQHADMIFRQNEISQRNSRFELLDEVLNERIRQITKHGYLEAHDDEHTDGSIADAAAHYASTKDDTGLWPWDPQYDKKRTKTRREQCITSMSMLMAEVERLDRESKQW